MSDKVKQRLARKEQKLKESQQKALDEALNKAGCTMEQILECIDPCHCCFTGLPEEANEHRALNIYWSYIHE